jgi:hypothetical protein
VVIGFRDAGETRKPWFGDIVGLDIAGLMKNGDAHFAAVRRSSRRRRIYLTVFAKLIGLRGRQVRR